VTEYVPLPDKKIPSVRGCGDGAMDGLYWIQTRFFVDMDSFPISLLVVSPTKIFHDVLICESFMRKCRIVVNTDVKSLSYDPSGPRDPDHRKAERRFGSVPGVSSSHEGKNSVAGADARTASILHFENKLVQDEVIVSALKRFAKSEDVDAPTLADLARRGLSAFDSPVGLMAVNSTFLQ
jgi:hypothetical protein